MIPLKIALRLNGRLTRTFFITFDPNDTPDMSGLYGVIVDRADSILTERIDTGYYSNWVISNGDFEFTSRDSTSILTANTLLSINLYNK